MRELCEVLRKGLKKKGLLKKTQTHHKICSSRAETQLRGSEQDWRKGIKEQRSQQEMK